MLLIYPPTAKPSEPPAGIARLAGALKAHGIPCTLLDMNIEALLWAFEQPLAGSDTWTIRAGKNRVRNMAALRDPRTYSLPDRYSRAVHDLARVLEVVGKDRGAAAGLADYQDARLSPLRSADLIEAAEFPERNLYYPYFKKRLPEIIDQTFSLRRRPEREGNPKDKVSRELKLPAASRRESRFSRLENDRIRSHSPEQAGNVLTPELIGFSLNYLSQALCTFSMIGFVKKEFPGVRIVLGGGLVTSWMKRPGWDDPFRGLVDQLIAGAGETPLLNLLGVKEVRHVDSTPDYEGLPLADYLSPGLILPYSASRGCYWNRCSFCPEPAEGNPYTPVPSRQVMSDLKVLLDRNRPVLLHLLDNAVSPALLHAFADIPFGIPWYGFVRIGSELCDLDFCRALKRSGCAMLKLGLESGDQDVLDRMQKGIDLGTASRVLRNLEKAGIAAYVYLLFGTPAETVREARKTLAFIEQHRHAVSFLNLAIFNMPLSGTDARAYGTGQFYEGDLSLYTAFRHPDGWDRKQVRLFLDDEFKRNASVSAILKNDPPVFTSNHAAFFSPAWV